MSDTLELIAENVDASNDAIPHEADDSPRRESVRETIERSVDEVERASDESRTDDEESKPKRTRLRERRERAADAQQPEPRQEQDRSAAEETSTPQTEPQRLEAPVAWTKEARQDWNSLPDRAKREIIKREQDMARGVESLKARYAPIDQAAAKYRAPLSRTGLNDYQAVDTALGWLVNLADGQLPVQNRTQHAAMLVNQLVNIGAIDPNLMLQQLGIQAEVPQQQPQYVTPQQVSQLVNNQLIARDQQAAVELDNARTVSLYQNWRRDKPHIDAVEPYVLSLLTANPATGQAVIPLSQNNDDAAKLQRLDQAYQQAIWAHPDIRTQLERDRIKQIANAQQAEVNRARRASGSVSTSAPGTQIGRRAAPQRGLSVRESLKQAITELSS